MARATRAKVLLSALTLVVSATLMTAPVARAETGASRIPAGAVDCAGRYDFANVTSYGQLYCWANQGSYPIGLRGVTKICSGNNGVDVYSPGIGWIRIPRKWDCRYPNSIYLSPTITLYPGQP